MSDRVEAYRKMVAELFGPLPSGVSIHEDELQRAEQRLGVRIPPELRALFLACGRHRGLAASFNRLLGPRELSVADDKLVFAEENQSVVFWAADLSSGDSDPCVYQAANAEPLEWYPEDARCSEFIRIFALWQAVNGGLPYSAIGETADPSIFEICDEQLEFIVEHSGLRIYRDGRTIIALLLSPDQVGVNLGSPTPHAIEHIRGLLGITWDWSSSDE
jgi:hypothetical protein